MNEGSAPWLTPSRARRPTAGTVLALIGLGAAAVAGGGLLSALQQGGR